MIQSYAIGDFDGDNYADAVLATIPAFNPFVGRGSWDVSVLFGNGTSSFEYHPLYSTDAWSDLPTLGTGDVDSDGHSDIFFIEPTTNELWVYLGHYGRSFTQAASVTPGSVGDVQHIELSNGTFAMGDFNNDGRMDLVEYANNIIGTSGTNNYLMFMLGAGAPGTFKYQLVPLPATYSQASQAVVGDFNGDTRPDVLLGFQNGEGGASTLLTATNTTLGGTWSNCDYPMRGRRISLCSPIGFSDGQVSFNATANSFGLLRKMELWVDGTKIAEQRHTWENRAWLNFTDSLAPGVHNATIFADDIDHSLNNLNFSFTVGDDGCAQPPYPASTSANRGTGRS
ncbi:MAG: FG-GAP repeat domain-containing protein [Terriglobales bacterium]